MVGATRREVKVSTVPFGGLLLSAAFNIGASTFHQDITHHHLQAYPIFPPDFAKWSACLSAISNA